LIVAVGGLVGDFEEGGTMAEELSEHGRAGGPAEVGVVDLGKAVHGKGEVHGCLIAGDPVGGPGHGGQKRGDAAGVRVDEQRIDVDPAGRVAFGGHARGVVLRDFHARKDKDGRVGGRGRDDVVVGDDDDEVEAVAGNGGFGRGIGIAGGVGVHGKLPLEPWEGFAGRGRRRRGQTGRGAETRGGGCKRRGARWRGAGEKADTAASGGHGTMRATARHAPALGEASGVV